MASLPQHILFKERMAKMEWLKHQIQALLKNDDLGYSTEETLRAEIAAKRQQSQHDEDLRINAILNHFKMQYDPSDLESKMMHSILLQFDDIVLYNHRDRKRNPQKSVLGFVLMEYFHFHEYFEIVNRLLTNNNIKLLTHEIPIFVKLFEDAAGSQYSLAYFALFEKVLKQNNILMLAVRDEAGNTPIHQIIRKADIWYIEESLAKLTKLCRRYPEWLFVENQKGNTPLVAAAKRKDIDLFFILSRFMFSFKKAAFEEILTTKKCVGLMIETVIDLFEKGRSQSVQLLLQCFDYYQILHFDPEEMMQIDNVETAGHQFRMT